MILTVTDLTPDPDFLQHKILCEHVSDVGIDLRHCVYILHTSASYAILTSCSGFTPVSTTVT